MYDIRFRAVTLTLNPVTCACLQSSFQKYVLEMQLQILSKNGKFLLEAVLAKNFEWLLEVSISIIENLVF